VDKTPIVGMPSEFGTSYDHCSELGFFGPLFVVNSFARSNCPSLRTSFVRALSTPHQDSASPSAAATTSRASSCKNENPDPTEPDLLTGTHTYERFNSKGGATCSLA